MVELMNGVVVGRTYAIDSSPMTSDIVTVLDERTLAVFADYERIPYLIDIDRLDEIADSADHKLRHKAWNIRRHLLTHAHDACKWTWVEQRSNTGVWIRPGACPTCGKW